MLGEFLRDIKKAPENVKYADMVNVLVIHSQYEGKGSCKRTQHCWVTTCNIVGPNMLRPFAWNHNNVGTCCV